MLYFLFQEPHGWLVDLVNRVSTEFIIYHKHVRLSALQCLILCFSFFVVKFGELGGFTAIQTKLNFEDIEIAVRISLLVACFFCVSFI